MRILFLGDIVGKSGRNVVIRELPQLRKNYNIDCVIANAENATHGFGLSAQHFYDILQAGVDFVTLGNHAWDQADIVRVIHESKQIVRPHNYPSHHPGTGVGVAICKNQQRVLIVQVAGMLAMTPGTTSPFDALDKELPEALPCPNFDAVVVDVHAEFTAEKSALGFHVDGRASLVVGTHTHIPTADHRILENGTAYITDVGMCGDYQSVIGFDAQLSIQRQMNVIPKPRLEITRGPAALCGVMVDTDPANSLATAVHPIRIGASLENTLP